MKQSKQTKTLENYVYLRASELTEGMSIFDNKYKTFDEIQFIEDLGNEIYVSFGYDNDSEYFHHSDIVKVKKDVVL